MPNTHTKNKHPNDFATICRTSYELGTSTSWSKRPHYSGIIMEIVLGTHETNSRNGLGCKDRPTSPKREKSQRKESDIEESWEKKNNFACQMFKTPNTKSNKQKWKKNEIETSSSNQRRVSKYGRDLNMDSEDNSPLCRRFCKRSSYSNSLISRKDMMILVTLVTMSRTTDLLFVSNELLMRSYAKPSRWPLLKRR